MRDALVEYGEFVKVGGEEAEASDLTCDVPIDQFEGPLPVGPGDSDHLLADSPSQPKAVVGGSAAAELVNDDERVLRGRLASQSIILA